MIAAIAGASAGAFILVVVVAALIARRRSRRRRAVSRSPQTARDAPFMLKNPAFVGTGGQTGPHDGRWHDVLGASSTDELDPAFSEHAFTSTTPAKPHDYEYSPAAGALKASVYYSQPAPRPGDVAYDNAGTHNSPYMVLDLTAPPRGVAGGVVDTGTAAYNSSLTRDAMAYALPIDAGPGAYDRHDPPGHVDTRTAAYNSSLTRDAMAYALPIDAGPGAYDRPPMAAYNSSLTRDPAAYAISSDPSCTVPPTSAGPSVSQSPSRADSASPAYTLSKDPVGMGPFRAGESSSLLGSAFVKVGTQDAQGYEVPSPYTSQHAVAHAIGGEGYEYEVVVDPVYSKPT